MSDINEVELFGDIYDILDACTNDEIAPLVAILSNSSMSLLKITRNFERFYPDHARYADQISDEIYRISLIALGRSDVKRLPYNEMLFGLCKQIGIPAVLNDIGGSEAILLNTFSKQHLSSLPASERQRLVGEACVAASGAAKGILSSDAWQPFAATLLQIAHLRRTLIDDGRIATASHAIGTAMGDGVPAPMEHEADALVIQAEDGHPILALAVLPEDSSAGWLAPESSRKILNALTPILKAAQPYFSAEQMLKGQHLYRAKVALSHSTKVGGYVGAAPGVQGMVPLAMVTATGIAALPVALTLLAAMAEQKKLENIEKSLDEIKTSLKDVSKFQQNERRSVLTGSIRYFQQVAPSILNGELASEVLHEIERHEVELVRVQEHLVQDVQSQIAAMRAAKGVKQIQEVQASLSRMYDEVLLCIRARACGYQLLCVYPGREAGKKARLEDISKSLGLFSPTGEVKWPGISDRLAAEISSPA